MSAHSYIGVIEEDGTLKYVYCHSDGYPSYLGRMLLTYYNTPELATGLVNLGDLSMVRSMLRERLVPDKGKYHTFKKPVREGPKSGITTAYHRDRKERLHINKTVIGGPDISTNAKKAFLDITKSNYIPYAYLYDIAEKQWFAYDACQDCGFAFLNENYLQTHV